MHPLIPLLRPHSPLTHKKNAEALAQKHQWEILFLEEVEKCKKTFES
jgi:hypothetical protein